MIYFKKMYGKTSQMLSKDGILKKLQWNMIFLVLSGKIKFIFLKSIILLFRLKMKDHITQNNTWKYDIFCISGKDGIFFLQIWCWSEEDDPSNKKMILLLKKQRSSPVKLTFLVSLKKVIVILERMAFLLT